MSGLDSSPTHSSKCHLGISIWMFQALVSSGIPKLISVAPALHSSSSCLPASPLQVIPGAPCLLFLHCFYFQVPSILPPVTVSFFLTVTKMPEGKAQGEELIRVLTAWLFESIILGL